VSLLTNGFRTAVKRAEHFQKHQHECGGATSEFDYERRADAFLGGPLTPSVQQCVRPGGDVVRYDVSNGAFGCLSPDRYIRTYKIFTDVMSGLAYFQRQCARTTFP
jgi:hypothetical protein